MFVRSFRKYLVHNNYSVYHIVIRVLHIKWVKLGSYEKRSYEVETKQLR